MCGRFALRLPRGDIRRVPGHDDLEDDIDDWEDEDEFVPRYNIAPRSQAPVIRRRDPGPSDSGPTEGHGYILQTMKWGLVPSWSKFEDKSLSTTNARSENLIEGGGMWGSIKGKKRCAVLCQGYYEWLTKGKEKLPHFTKHKDGKLMLMAGLYDCVTLEGQSKPLWTFAIVTTAANKDFDWLHDRQPVILSTRSALDKWLDTSSQTWTPELAKLLDPYHDNTSPLECYQVPKEVGKVGTESSSFIEPVAQRKDGIEAMFTKQKTKAVKPEDVPSETQQVGQKRSRSRTPERKFTITPDTPSPKKVKVEKSPERGSPIHEIDLTNEPDTPAKKLKPESDGGKDGFKPKPQAQKNVRSPPPSPSKQKLRMGSPRKTHKSNSAAANTKSITSYFSKK